MVFHACAPFVVAIDTLLKFSTGNAKVIVWYINIVRGKRLKNREASLPTVKMIIN